MIKLGHAAVTRQILGEIGVKHGKFWLGLEPGESQPSRGGARDRHLTTSSPAQPCATLRKICKAGKIIPVSSNVKPLPSPAYVWEWSYRAQNIDDGRVNEA